MSDIFVTEQEKEDAEFEKAMLEREKIKEQRHVLTLAEIEASFQAARDRAQELEQAKQKARLERERAKQKVSLERAQARLARCSAAVVAKRCKRDACALEVDKAKSRLATAESYVAFCKDNDLGVKWTNLKCIKRDAANAALLCAKAKLELAERVLAAAEIAQWTNQQSVDRQIESLQSQNEKQPFQP